MTSRNCCCHVRMFIFLGLLITAVGVALTASVLVYWNMDESIYWSLDVDKSVNNSDFSTGSGANWTAIPLDNFANNATLKSRVTAERAPETRSTAIDMDQLEMVTHSIEALEHWKSRRLSTGMPGRKSIGTGTPIPIHLSTKMSTPKTDTKMTTEKTWFQKWYRKWSLKSPPN